MLPKLAEIFGISIDTLLGCEPPKLPEKVYETGLVNISQICEENTSEAGSQPPEKGTWELRWDGGKKSSIGMAVWVLLVGGLLLASVILQWNVGLWDILWPSALLVFGLFGLAPRFSFFHLGCALLGGYFLLDNLIHLALSSKLLLPVFLLLFGLSLLADALRKPSKGKFFIKHNGQTVSNHQCQCSIGEEAFECSTSFGENTHCIDLPRLSRGLAEVSFGEMTVDLTGCGEISENCRIEANCSFGEMILRVPSRYRIEPNTSTAFASLDTEGYPAAEPEGIIALDAGISFGQITIQYV